MTVNSGLTVYPTIGYLIPSFFGRFSEGRLLLDGTPVVVGVVLVVVRAVKEFSLLAGVEKIMLFGRRRFILFFHFLKLMFGPEENIFRLN
jgi:hypothetical protein